MEVALQAHPQTQSQTQRRWVRWPLAVAPYVVALGWGLLALWVFTRNNDFPISYHPDESSKVLQLLSPWERRNFNHPLLMLESADLVRKVFEVPRRQRDVVIAGRCTSAALASAGVVALALAGYAAFGWIGLLICGSAMALCPPLLVEAHYLKEDTSLAAGIMLAILGAVLVIRAGRHWTQLLATTVLATGCAAAMSGKYIGVATVIPALLTLGMARLFRWWAVPARFAVFALVTLVVAVAINHRAFRSVWRLELSRQAQSSMSEEVTHGTTGHDGLALAQPNAFCLRIALHHMLPHLWILGAAGLGWAIWKRRITRLSLVAASFLLTFAAVLSFNPIPFARYALPIAVGMYFAAGLLVAYGVAAIPMPGRWRALALVGCVASIVVFQGLRCANFNRQYADDSRQRLREWVAANLPADTYIVSDGYTGLGDPGDPWRFPGQARLRHDINRGFYAADFGPLESQANRGVDYVAVAWSNYQRFFEPAVGAMPGAERYLERQRKFYTDLFSRGQLVWSSVPEPPTYSYVNMELRLYRITHLATAPRPKPGVSDMLRRMFR